MKIKSHVPKQTIRSLVERSFILASLIILFITMVAALYFNQRSLQERRDSNLQKIHQILANLILPELTISNTSEIRRLLQLASSPDEIFIVVDNNGIALMPDYSKIVSLKPVLNSHETKNCESVKTFYRNINGSGYWVTCSPLIRDDILSGSKKTGMLFTFSKYKWLLFSPMMIYLIGIAMLTLFLIILWFRQVLYRRLLQPIVILDSRIVDMTKSPLTTNTAIGDIGNAPEEILSIKKAFETLLSNLQTEYRQRIESEKNAVLFELTVQVTHDVRSTLGVMEIILQSYAQYIPEADANMQREAIQSVRNIMENNLNLYRNRINLNKNHDSSYIIDNKCLSRPIFLYSLVENMISYKKQEWKNNPCQINYTNEPSDKYVCINLVPDDIKRVLSNLLNNAYESLNGKRFMENIGGSLELHSILGSGTQIILSFPKILKPSWLPDAVKLPSHSTIVVLDDDSSIHSLWRQRLHINTNTSVQHFLNTQDLINWYNQNPIISDSAVFLVDYELRNDNSNGLELLERLNLKDRGYLITSHAEEIHIQKQVAKLGVWLIPKSLIGDFPLLF